MNTSNQDPNFTHGGQKMSLSLIYEAQRKAYLQCPQATLAERLNRIDRLLHVLLGRSNDFQRTLKEDFGHRSPVQSALSDILGVLGPIKHTRAHTARWMKTQRVGNPLTSLVTGRGRIEWVPRGVVGIIAPWNFPVGLALQPLAAAFSAGNRAMVKVSEFTPATGELLQRAIAENFDPAEATVITGGPEVGAEFSQLPFDLMFFTGATGIARHIQRAAAENLTPVVLELGGKSPVVIGPKADLDFAAKRIAVGKVFNAGQICLSPDHVFVPAGRERAFADAMYRELARLYPTVLNNEDYTSIVAERHYRRLLSYLDDAKTKGATIISVNPAGEDFSHQPHYKLPPTLLLNVRDDMLIMQEEIFGPLLPIVGYGSLDEVVRQVNSRSRPLATYYFGPEDADCQRYLAGTISGGVTLNDVVLHVAHEDLPFGGVGESGMGYYHGRFGFETFSHPRSVVSAPRFSPNRLIAAPYGERRKRLLDWFTRREAAVVARRLGKG